MQAFFANSKKTPDYFSVDGDTAYAGKHLLVDLWGCKNLDNPTLILKCLEKGARTAGATILHSHAHHFSPFGGVSGVVVLAESHITIHTWPEREYAAIDIFMCGGCEPEVAISPIRKALQPDEIKISSHRRGEEVL